MKDGLGEDEVGGLHVCLLACVGVEPVVAVDAVGLGVEAGDEGDVVDVGNRGHHGVTDLKKALGADLIDIWGVAGLEVLGVEAVNDYYDYRVIHGDNRSTKRRAGYPTDGVGDLASVESEASSVPGWSGGMGRRTTWTPRARVRRMMVAKLGLPSGERVL